MKSAYFHFCNLLGLLATEDLCYSKLQISRDLATPILIIILINGYHPRFCFILTLSQMLTDEMSSMNTCSQEPVYFELSTTTLFVLIKRTLNSMCLAINDNTWLGLLVLLIEQKKNTYFIENWRKKSSHCTKTKASTPKRGKFVNVESENANKYFRFKCVAVMCTIRVEKCFQNTSSNSSRDVMILWTLIVNGLSFCRKMILSEIFFLFHV